MRHSPIHRDRRSLPSVRATAAARDRPGTPPPGGRALPQLLLADMFACRERACCGLRRHRWRDIAWLQSAETGPFSFLWCCQQLGLDPRAVRAAYFGGQGLPDCRFKRVKRVNRYPSLVA
jgi:hypothetical protein